MSNPIVFSTSTTHARGMAAARRGIAAVAAGTGRDGLTRRQRAARNWAATVAGTLADEGADSIGLKVVTDEGAKYRLVLDIDDVASLAPFYTRECEVWGIAAGRTLDAGSVF